MKQAPRIEIKYGRLIDPFFIEYSKHKHPSWVPPEEQCVREKVETFKTAWEEVGEKITRAIMEVTKFSFVREVFDVYIVSGTPRDMSDPIIIRSRWNPDEFIGSLLHEILHRFCTLNRIEFGYPSETRSTQTHIYVFALIEYTYRDVLNDEVGLEAIKLRADENNPEYRRAWEVVSRDGYKSIIKGMKKTPQ